MTEAVKTITGMGLSPRLRGNARLAFETPQHVGSIPALAGERLHVTRRGKNQRVYPRACGGTDLPFGFVWREKGLSPRLRGNDPSGPHPARIFGFIPALAGERLADFGDDRDNWVYPRACGGTGGIFSTAVPD